MNVHESVVFEIPDVGLRLSCAEILFCRLSGRTRVKPDSLCREGILTGGEPGLWIEGVLDLEIFWREREEEPSSFGTIAKPDVDSDVDVVGAEKTVGLDGMLFIDFPVFGEWQDDYKSLLYIQFLLKQEISHFSPDWHTYSCVVSKIMI